MKKMIIALVAMLTIAAGGHAMSYEQARNEALFLTDKMAYELNLTDAQYEAAYEINLDYLMGVTSYDDVFSTYWERRNLDMSYILLDWQWQAFCAATYFYRPLYWDGGYWHFAVYARYPHRDYFYFGRPAFYASYRGGHAWHYVGGNGWYYSRRASYHPAGPSHFGMLDRWNRGDFHHVHGGRPGGNRISSTRSTVNHGGSMGGRRTTYESGRSFNNGGSRPGGSRPSSGGSYGSSGSGRSYGSGSFSSGGSRPSSGGSYGSSGSGRSYGSGSFSSGGSRPSSGGSYGSSGSGRSYGSGSFGSGGSRPSSSGSYGSSGSGRSYGSGSFSSGGSSRSSGSFSSGGSSRSSGSFSSGGSSRSSGSFSSGGSSRSSGSFSSGGSRGNSGGGGGRSSSGGRSFGGHR